MLLFSCSVGSISFQSGGLQHARLLCPSPSPGACSNSCPLHPSVVMSSNHLILCPPLLLLPSIFPSIRVFSNKSALCIRWPKYWSFSFSISPSNKYSGLISFRIDWFDLLAVQGLSTQRHPGKFPKVPGRRRGTRGFPAAPRQRPRESFFKASRGPSPLP